MKASLEQFLASARWFSGKGRGFEVSRVRPYTLTDSLRVLLVDVTFAGGDGATYQVPVAYYSAPQGHLDHALIGTWFDEALGEVFAYDALHDHAQTPFIIESFASASAYGELSFLRACDYDLDVDARSAVLSVEQSNTSVAFGEDSLLKVFRRVTPGINPDIEVHKRLTDAGVENIAQLYGWIELNSLDSPDEEPLQLAMLQQFLRTASDGWEIARTSVRDLLAEPDVPAGEAGGDFAAEAERLGIAVGHIHLALSETFTTSTVEPADLADSLVERLYANSDGIEPAQPFIAAAHKRIDALRTLTTPMTIQRIHGDLHLGQTLRTVKGWKIVDFEGEPAKPLAERILPDSPWRDVAGMLRSLDYASASFDDATPETSQVGGHVLSRASEWAQRNRTAFLDGYAGATNEDPFNGDVVEILAAYEIDKAIYEVGYEVRNRPDWVHIPLAALRRLLA